jgi:hypothetical protein
MFFAPDFLGFHKLKNLVYQPALDISLNSMTLTTWWPFYEAPFRQKSFWDNFYSFLTDKTSSKRNRQKLHVFNSGTKNALISYSCAKTQKLIDKKYLNVTGKI